MDKTNNKENQILLAAETLFLKKGFALTTTTEIAKKAGCNQALVHYYFRTKEKLFESIFHKKVLVFLSSFNKLEEEKLTIEEQIKSKMESYFDMLYENQNMPFMILNEMITNPDRIKSFKSVLTEQAPLYRKFVTEFKQQISLGRIRDVSPVDILFTGISLNIFVFIMKPLTMEMLGLDEEGFNQFAINRKKENVITILKSLQP